MHPKVTVKIDKEFDKEIFLYFIDEKIGDFDFGYDRIIKGHPDLLSARGKKESARKKIIDPYIDHYYTQYKQNIVASQTMMQEIWNHMADEYFIHLTRIFGSLDFYTEKNVTAYLSIAKCGVIGDDYTDFQIWYKTMKEPDEVRRHFAHEILHFYYYSYIKEKGYTKLRGQWDLAEIFNVVILGLPEFVTFIGKEDHGYEQHEPYFSYYKNLWNTCDTIDAYLTKTNAEGLRASLESPTSKKIILFKE